MNDLAGKLALIVCEQCKRSEGESEIDFSTRLLSVYNSCHDNIANIINQDKQEIINDSVQKFLGKNYFSHKRQHLLRIC